LPELKTRSPNPGSSSSTAAARCSKCLRMRQFRQPDRISVPVHVSRKRRSINRITSGRQQFRRFRQIHKTVHPAQSRDLSCINQFYRALLSCTGARTELLLKLRTGAAARPSSSLGRPRRLMGASSIPIYVARVASFAKRRYVRRVACQCPRQAKLLDNQFPEPE
jgi:hypothetical protein